jgi:hypothetical protein
MQQSFCRICCSSQDVNLQVLEGRVLQEGRVTKRNVPALLTCAQLCSACAHKSTCSARKLLAAVTACIIHSESDHPHLLLLLLLVQVQGLALQFLTAWAAAGQAQAQVLSKQGLAPALGQLAMDAVAAGEQGRELQAAVCR